MNCGQNRIRRQVFQHGGMPNRPSGRTRNRTTLPRQTQTPPSLVSDSGACNCPSWGRTRNLLIQSRFPRMFWRTCLRIWPTDFAQLKSHLWKGASHALQLGPTPLPFTMTSELTVPVNTPAVTVRSVDEVVAASVRVIDLARISARSGEAPRSRTAHSARPWYRERSHGRRCPPDTASASPSC